MKKHPFFPLSALKVGLIMAVSSAALADNKLSPVNVEGSTMQSESKILKIKDDTIITESISAEKIARKQAATLSEAIANEPGVRVSAECSMCGVKRIMLNGLKGEHTTLMINGVPNSSFVEGFYGFDAIPMAGVSAVEISRGAGPSLIAPEAIGGVVNVVTNKPREDKLSVDLSAGNQEYRKYQITGSKISKDGNTAMTLSAQSDNIDQYDQDNNWVNEAPALNNRSVTAQVWHKLDADNQIDVRVEDIRSEVFGGPMVGSDLAGAGSESEARSSLVGSGDFEGGNVNNRPDGDMTARDFLENIVSEKQSVTAKWTSDVNDKLRTRVTGSVVDSKMDAIYEPTTYTANQDIMYLDVRGDYFLNDEHFLTFGTDMKVDKMRSESGWQTRDNDGNDISGDFTPANDSYDMTTNGLYIRDTWTPKDSSLELAVAVRLDKIDVDFVDQPGNDFNETLVSPRLHVRYDHNFNWTSRFSAGQGYRVPLQFFESDHGILEDGFAVDVDKIEKSTNVHYALNYSGDETFFETSLAWAKVDNLTFIDADNYAVPTLVNSDESGVATHADATVSHQLTDHLSIGGGVEVFQYDKAYRDTFGVIPVEERVKFVVDYETNDWNANLTVTGVGSRDFSDYEGAGYAEHTNDAAGNDSKGTKSPAYVTADIKVAKNFDKNWQVYAGVNNLTDYTQTSKESPLFYDGGEWDVGHIWGPLRGRTVYAGTKLTF